jgi:hypothetical protein
VPNPSIKNEPMYRALRRQGMSKTRAARISNAARFKAATLATLEAYVSAPDYAPPVAQALASLIPELPAFKGESLGPGITRIRGNLCNVHGRYGPCDAAQSGKKPPKGRKPAKAAAAIPTPAATVVEATETLNDRIIVKGAVRRKLPKVRTAMTFSFKVADSKGFMTLAY